MSERTIKLPADEAQETQTEIERFSRSQRIEHGILLVSFTLLGITGMVQLFATHPLGELGVRLLGGIEFTRIIHRIAAVALLGVSIYHIIAVLYRFLVQRRPVHMLPGKQDLEHLYQDILYYVGRREHKARYDRYSYAEKMEYLAVVWGTLIMAITGFMMWNPIATARLLPGEFIPAAKAAHGGEALLAVLAIILWHFYHVHIRHLNRSIFTGKMTLEEMQHEHPAELERIQRGLVPPPPDPEIIRRRERYFIPLATVLTILMGVALVSFVTFEETAIATVPPGEQAQVFAPQTPTPAPTFPPSPTSPDIEAASWDGGFESLFDNRCGTCHGITSVGGLSLNTYEQALEGGESGPAIIPGDAEASQLIVVQSQGGHPGQLTDEELQQVIDWIEAGAPPN